MVSKKVVVTNKTGLHARPASNLVAFCKNYNSKIFLSNGEKKVSAASIIHVLTLGVKNRHRTGSYRRRRRRSNSSRRCCKIHRRTGRLRKEKR